MFGLLRATLALVGIVLFLPMVGLTSVILPAAALTKWLATNFTYGLLFFFAFLLLGLFFCWLVARGRYKRYASIVQVVFAVVAFLVVFSVDLKVASDFEGEGEVKPLSWEVYQEFCHQPSWEEGNVAVVQERCVDLDGVKVSWEGYVNHVRIRTIRNPLKAIFDKLPQSLSYYLYCMYGEEIKDDCDGLKDNCLSFYDSVRTKHKCTLAKYNKYTFEITVRMKSGMWGKTSETVLIVEDYFRNFSFSLKPSDHVWFKGPLTNEEASVGGLRPRVLIDEIGCLDCHSSGLTQMKLNTKVEIKVKDVVQFLYLGVKCVLNFLFNPVVVFK